MRLDSRPGAFGSVTSAVDVLVLLPGHVDHPREERVSGIVVRERVFWVQPQTRSVRDDDATDRDQRARSGAAAEKTDEAGFGREVLMLAAVKLYELGRLSSGRAAELAGMARVELLLNLGRYRVFPLEDELRDLEQGRG